MMRLPYIIPADPQPKWVNAEKTMVDVRVIFPHIDMKARYYTAAQSDPGWEHSEEIFARVVAGEFGPIAPYVAPEYVPVPLTARQLKIGLLREGITEENINSIIDEIPDPLRRAEARIEWDYATEYRYEHPLVQSVADRLRVQLNLTSKEVVSKWKTWSNI